MSTFRRLLRRFMPRAAARMDLRDLAAPASPVGIAWHIPDGLCVPPDFEPRPKTFRLGMFREGPSLESAPQAGLLGNALAGGMAAHDDALKPFIMELISPTDSQLQRQKDDFVYYMTLICFATTPLPGEADRWADDGGRVHEAAA